MNERNVNLFLLFFVKRSQGRMDGKREKEREERERALWA